MKRQNANKEALVYAYGIIPDSILNDDNVQEETERMRLMWDALVDLEHEHEAKLDKAMQEDSPEYVQAKQDLERLNVALREAAQDRAKFKDEASKIKVGEVAALRNEAQKLVWQLASDWFKANKQKSRELNAERKQSAKEIRQNSGLFWSNYNQVLDNFETARIATKKKGRKMRYSNWYRDDGFLTVQIQRTASGLGADPEELMDGSFNALQIGWVDPKAWELPRAARTRACKTKVEMRVDAAGNMVRCPVWIHRGLPEGCRVKKAQLAWKKQGETFVGKLCLTISKEKEHVLHPINASAEVGFCWEYQDDGSLLVATTQDDSGNIERHTLPADWMSGLDQADRLLRHINTETLTVAKYLYRKKGRVSTLFLDAISEWKPGKRAKWINTDILHDAVRHSNFRAPAEVLHWYRRYRHLNVWRENLRSKLLRRRREIYRLLARDLASRFAVLIVDNIDLAKSAKQKEDNLLRSRAGIYQLRSELKHQARKHGAEIINRKVEPVTQDLLSGLRAETISDVSACSVA